MTWWNRGSRPDDEVLHETDHPIRGDEPFLRYGDTGLIVTFCKQGYGNHNFIERLGSPGVPISKLKKGDTLRFQMVRVSSKNLTLWQKIKELFR